MRRDPVDAGAFHRHRFYLSLFEPLRHPHQFWRCCSEIRHFSTASLQPWRAHPVPLTADINSRYLGAYYGQPCNGPRTAGTIPTLPVIPHPRSTFPNTTAQVGRYAESALGERYRSLTNVQLPNCLPGAMLQKGHTHQWKKGF